MDPGVWRWQWLAMAVLTAGLVLLPWNQPISWLVIGLGVLTALKLREARQRPEHRLVGLLQLVLAGLLGALQPELGPSLLQGLAVLLALAGLLAQELGQGPGWRLLLRRSATVLLAALPMALVLFLLVPRLAPFNQLPDGQGQGALTGLSENLEPGAIAALGTNSAPAARVVFVAGAAPPPSQRYWRVLVHERFDGSRWSSLARRSLPAAGAEETLGEAAGQSDLPILQLWLNEPSGLGAVPWSGAGRPRGPDLKLRRNGELQHRGGSGQRRLYGIDAGTTPWQRQPPSPWALALPEGSNPRLEALGRDWRRQPTATERLAAAERWFRQGGYRYSRTPGTLPAVAPLDAFLFERRQGFCGHYASAFTALMRAAGVPARVVSGYVGGQWVQPLGSRGYLDLRQSDAHAWSEVWLEGEGWRRVDPSTWVAGGGLGEGQPATGWGGVLERGPLGWLRHQWWGLDLAWSQLWLGFDRDRQAELLQRLIGGDSRWLGLVVLGALGLGLAIGVGVMGWLRSRGGDPWRRELERSLVAFAPHGLAPAAGESLPRFAARARQRWPELEDELHRLVALYERHRFAGPGDCGGAGVSPRQLRMVRRRLVQRLRRLPR
jgi:transglutaminase-like putative cysteine protease